MSTNKMDKTIFVITHKEVSPITDNPIYRFLQVGAFNKPHFAEFADDTGDNISCKNNTFCELTGQYWIWKNYTDSDIVGLCHYRRYFFNGLNFIKIILSGKNQEPIDGNYIDKALKHHQMIVRYSFRGRFVAGTIYNYYSKHHYRKDMDTARKVLHDIFPDYLESFDKVIFGYKIHPCNMIICRKEIFDSYSEWLFKVLFRLEQEIDISDYDDYQKRVFGFLSERLLRVWIVKNHISIKECCVHYVNDNRSLLKRIQDELK